MMFGLFANQLSWWGWFGMTLGMVVFWGLVIAAIVLLVRGSSPSGVQPPPPDRPTPEQLLAERFARGEIDEAAYRRGLDALRTVVTP